MRTLIHLHRMQGVENDHYKLSLHQFHVYQQSSAEESLLLKEGTLSRPMLSLSHRIQHCEAMYVSMLPLQEAGKPVVTYTRDDIMT